MELTTTIPLPRPSSPASPQEARISSPRARQTGSVRSETPLFASPLPVMIPYNFGEGIKGMNRKNPCSSSLLHFRSVICVETPQALRFWTHDVHHPINAKL